MMPCDICQRVFASLWVGNVQSELLHTYSRVDPLDVLILLVRLAVLVAVTLTVPVVLFPVRHLSYYFSENVYIKHRRNINNFYQDFFTPPTH